MRRPVSASIALLAMSFVVACGEDPVSYSAPVTINLKAKADDVKADAIIVDDKNINTESGNPYAAFIQTARQRLGRDPGRIEVASATLLLGGTSKGITALEQAMTGRAEVLFVTNDTNHSFLVGYIDAPRGSGPLAMAIVLDPTKILGDDMAKLVSGSFKVVLRSASAAGFAGRKDIQADLQVTFEFAAFE